MRDCAICVAKTKGTDQLCSYCTADLRPCFRIGKNDAALVILLQNQ